MFTNDSDNFSFPSSDSDELEYYWKLPQTPGSWSTNVRALHFKEIIERRMGVNLQIFFHAAVQEPFSFKAEIEDDLQVRQLRQVFRKVDKLLGSYHTVSRDVGNSSVDMVQYSIRKDIGGGLRLYFLRFATFVVNCVNILIRFGLNAIFTAVTAMKWCISKCLSGFPRRLFMRRSVKHGDINRKYSWSEEYEQGLYYGRPQHHTPEVVFSKNKKTFGRKAIDNDLF